MCIRDRDVEWGIFQTKAHVLKEGKRIVKVNGVEMGNTEFVNMLVRMFTDNKGPVKLMGPFIEKRCFWEEKKKNIKYHAIVWNVIAPFSLSSFSVKRLYDALDEKGMLFINISHVPLSLARTKKMLVRLKEKFPGLYIWIVTPGREYVIQAVKDTSFWDYRIIEKAWRDMEEEWKRMGVEHPVEILAHFLGKVEEVQKPSKKEIFWRMDSPYRISSFFESFATKPPVKKISLNGELLARYLKRKGDIELSAGRAMKAHHFYNKSIEIYPTVSALLGRGKSYMLINEISEGEFSLFALQNFLGAMELDKKSYRTVIELADLYVKQELYRAAIYLLDTLLVSHPDEKRYWNVLFSAYYGAGEFRRGLWRLKELGDDTLSIFFEDWMGVFYTEIENYKRADECFRDILKRDPFYFLAYRHHAELLLKRRKCREALRWAKKYVKHFPLSKKGRLLMGDIYLCLGNKEKAAKNYLVVLEIDPKDRIARDRLESMDY